MFSVIIFIIAAISEATFLEMPACGIITKPAFTALLGNETCSDFESLADACNIANIRFMDRSQASFFLGQAAYNLRLLSSELLTSSSEGLIETTFSARGSYLLEGESVYGIFTTWAKTLGVTAVLPTDVATNSTISFLSGLFRMLQGSPSCMQLTSARRWNTCMVQLNFTDAGDRLEYVRLASIALGYPLSLAQLDDQESSAAVCQCPTWNATASESGNATLSGVVTDGAADDAAGIVHNEECDLRQVNSAVAPVFECSNETSLAPTYPHLIPGQAHAHAQSSADILRLARALIENKSLNVSICEDELISPASGRSAFLALLLLVVALVST